MPLKGSRSLMPDSVREALDQQDLTGSTGGGRPISRMTLSARFASRAKREATKQERLQQMLEELKRGDVYMNISWKKREALRLSLKIEN